MSVLPAYIRFLLAGTTSMARSCRIAAYDVCIAHTRAGPALETRAAYQGLGKAMELSMMGRAVVLHAQGPSPCSPRIDVTPEKSECLARSSCDRYGHPSQDLWQQHARVLLHLVDSLSYFSSVYAVPKAKTSLGPANSSLELHQNVLPAITTSLPAFIGCHGHDAIEGVFATILG